MNEDDPPPRLFSPGFWVALGFGLVLILAGAAVGLIGPHWLATHPQGAPARRRALTGPKVRGKEPGHPPAFLSEIQHEVLVGQSRSGDQAGLSQLPSQIL